MTKRELFDSIRGHVSDSLNLHLTDEQVQELVSDRHVGAEIREWGPGDTETRSAMANFLTQKLLGRRVPLNGDKEDMPKFWAALHAQAELMGYKVGYVMDDPEYVERTRNDGSY